MSETKETMNVQMEKFFFTWVCEHPSQFVKVEPQYFKNDDIRFIYKIVRDEYIVSKKVASPQQIVAMIKLHDPEEKINNNVIKVLLKNDNSVHDQEWLNKHFKAWKLSNLLKNRTYETIDQIRNIKDIDYDNVLDIASNIKQIYNNLSIIEDEDEDLGVDFDDPEAHKQETNTNKIPSGWGNVDQILQGGWDKSSFSVLMGETGIGKSMWLINITKNSAEHGFNVAYVTVEMHWRKVMKRLGAMRFKIDADQYAEISKDSTFIKTKINQLKNSSNIGLFNTGKPGKIFVKKFNTGSCTINDIDNFLTKLQEAKKLKIDMVVIDYINLMSVDKLNKEIGNNLYLKGKHLAEGLRYLGDKFDASIITATQVDKAIWGANDVKLQDIPESKAVAETADCVWAIIRNNDMKRNNKYRLKILKLRDGEHKGELILFDFNPRFLTIDNDILEGTTSI
jgi:replicative DNA helicase